jgi:hypothetical protein
MANDSSSNMILPPSILLISCIVHIIIFRFLSNSSQLEAQKKTTRREQSFPVNNGLERMSNQL